MTRAVNLFPKRSLPEPTHPLSFRASRRLKERLERISKETGRSRSEVIVTLLEAGLVVHERDKRAPKK